MCSYVLREIKPHPNPDFLPKPFFPCILSLSLSHPPTQQDPLKSSTVGLCRHEKQTGNKSCNACVVAVALALQVVTFLICTEHVNFLPSLSRLPSEKCSTRKGQGSRLSPKRPLMPSTGEKRQTIYEPLTQNLVQNILKFNVSWFLYRPFN